MELLCEQPHRRLQSLPSALDRAQRGKIVARERRIVQQPDQKCRHHFQMCDPMLLDQREDFLRAGARAHHHSAAVEHASLDAGASQRQIVRDGQNDQKHGLTGETANRRRGFGVVGVIVVSPGYQLGNTRGPAGELKHSRVRGIDSD